MAKRLVESLEGVGAIYAGDMLLREVPYRISVWEDDAEGHIDISGMGEAVVLAGPDSLILHLQDGRRMPFQLTSSTGAIVGRGGLRPA